PSGRGPFPIPHGAVLVVLVTMTACRRARLADCTNRRWLAIGREICLRPWDRTRRGGQFQLRDLLGRTNTDKVRIANWRMCRSTMRTNWPGEIALTPPMPNK